MESKIFKLAFQGPVHFGSGRLSDAEYTCDAATLFSALFIEALALGCPDELLHAANCGDCTLSDCFPYIGSTLYVPKPMGITFFEEEAGSEKEADSRSRKAGKKLLYIPARSFNEYLKGNFDFIQELEHFKLGQSALRTKVNLERATSNDAKPYHVGGYSFYSGCGIYFIYQGKYDIEPLVKSLSFSGIGGKRSSGYGMFTYTIEDVSCLNAVLAHETSTLGVSASEEKQFMLLSSAAPNKDELTDELLRHASYKLERRGGFVQSITHAQTPRKKQDMWVFRPGSLFSCTFEGSVFNVNKTADAHAVYRYARALWMEV